MNLTILFLSFFVMFSCTNGGLEEIDSRGDADKFVPVPFNGSKVDFGEFSLSPASDMSDFPTSDFQNFLLATKTLDGTNLLIGKDGRSFIYGGDQGLVEVASPITASDNRRLLTLDEENFWLVNELRVSRSKPTDQNSNEIPLSNFSLDNLEGTKEGLRVIGVSHEALILHLSTHIAVFVFNNDLSEAFEFKLSQLPSVITGEIVSAGFMSGGRYWFASSDGQFLILSREESEWVIADLKINTSEPILSIGLQLNWASKQVEGDVIAITATTVSSTLVKPLISTVVNESE